MDKFLNKNKCVFYILVCTLIIEAINGVYISFFNKNSSWIGTIFRIVVLAYFLLNYLLSKKKASVILIGLFLYFICNVMYSYYVFDPHLDGLRYNITENVRILLPMVIILGLKSMIQKNELSVTIFDKIMQQSIKIIICIYLFGWIFGIGKSTYLDAGYKSVFNSINSLNIVLIVLFIFQIERTIKIKKNILEIFYCVFIFIALILLGTKSSIIIVAFYFFIRILLSKLNVFMLKKFLVAIVMILLISIFMYTVFRKQISSIFIRQLYMFENSGSLISTYLFSGRNELLVVSLRNYLDNLSVANLFLGIGSNYNQKIIASVMQCYGVKKSIEMDLFDILISNGIIGIVITYGISIIQFLKNYKVLRKNGRYDVIISFIVFIIYSITGGHVFTDSLGTTYFAITTAMCLVENEEYKEV